MTTYKIYRTTSEKELFQSVSLEQCRADMSKNKGTANAASTVTVRFNDRETYQEMDGFGASFTDAAAYLMHQKLTEKQQNEVMTRLFHPVEGIGLSVIRNPMGASDYARTVYSYNDLPDHQTDPDLSGFSIAHDEADIIPLTRQALALNPELKLFASPWSAPGWMKTSGSMITGQLKPEWYSAYAAYFVKYIQSYAAHGLSIYAVTPQNEALYEPGHYPGMLMPAEAQAEFIQHHLKPAFVRSNLQTKILCYDHNWDRPDYPLKVLEQAGGAVDGVAWHWYGGNAAAQTQVYEAFAGKEVHFTEGSGGEWIPPFEQAFSNVIRTGIQILRNYSKSMILWNIALDEQNGPTVPGFGQSTCRGIIQINQQTGELVYTLDYYALAHFSTFIRPKAVQIHSISSDDTVFTVAFRNTDGSIALVLFNDGQESKQIVVQMKEGEQVNLSMEPKCALSILMS